LKGSRIARTRAVDNVTDFTRTEAFAIRSFLLPPFRILPSCSRRREKGSNSTSGPHKLPEKMLRIPRVMEPGHRGGLIRKRQDRGEAMGNPA
jgi:hypothetical protein